jgi:hypothetical protein
MMASALVLQQLAFTFHDLRTRSRILQEIIVPPSAPSYHLFCDTFGTGSLGCGLVCIDAVIGQCTLAVFDPREPGEHWQDDSHYAVYDCIAGDVGAFVRGCERSRRGREVHGVPKGWVAVAASADGGGALRLSVAGGGAEEEAVVFDTLLGRRVFGWGGGGGWVWL